MTGNDWSWTIATQTLEGAVEGFAGAMSYPHLEECAGDVGTLFPDLDAAVSGLKARSVSGIKAAVAKVGKAFKEVRESPVRTRPV